MLICEVIMDMGARGNVQGALACSREKTKTGNCDMLYPSISDGQITNQITSPNHQGLAKMI